MPNNEQTPFSATVLAVSGSTMMTLASVIDPLRAANRLAGTNQFQWQLLSADGADVEFSGGLAFPVSGKFSNADRGEMLIVVASFDHQKHVTPDLLSRLRGATRNFDIICGVEAGTWLLARAGLIEGKQVTTHWEDLENLQQAYPNADISDARYVIDGRIWTCGGASPAFDMMLHLIESRQSPRAALEVASVFVYDRLHSAHDRQPTTSLGILEQNEPLLAAAIRMMEGNLDAPVTTAAIARRLGISVKTLESRFRRSLQVTPGHYYLNLRLQLARKLVTDTSLGMQEIAVRSGFGSQSAFSRAFRTMFAKSPLEVRQGGA
ncbi:MAG: GlxA family transcriptional regulator [Rhizobiaceae bacterium]